MALFAAGACSCDGGASDSASSSSSGAGGAATSTGVAAGTSVGSVASSASAASSGAVASSSSSSSGGGGDADWRPVPWWKESCPFLYAGNPAAAFPKLEWTSCTGGETGCTRLVKNWDPFVNTGQGVSSARPRDGGHDLALSAFVGEGDSEVIVVGPDGVATAVYRRPLGELCGPTVIHIASGGYWVGSVKVTEAAGIGTYAFQPDGLAPEDAVVSPLTHDSQRQDGGNSIYAIEWFAAAKLEIFDSQRGQSFATEFGPGSTVFQPRVNDSSVFFSRADAIDDPTAWVWERSTGAFRELIGAGDNVVADIRGDDETMVWIEDPPVEGGVYPPGTIYSSPFTTDPGQIVPTARWSNVHVSPGPPSTMGAGFYAVADNDQQIRVLRLSDGRRWTIPTPRDEFSSGIRSLPYIDDKYMFFSTEVEIFRIDMTEIGPGMAAER